MTYLHESTNNFAQVTRELQTNTIQQAEIGAFLNGNRKDTGIAFETPTQVIISNSDFIVSGARYHWEAAGE